MASRVAEDIGRVPPPFEIRWDAGSGVRVEDEGESESGYGSQSSSVKISLSPNGPWAPVGVRQLGASSAAAVGVGPNRGTVLVVDRRRGCVRAPATLSSLLPFQLEARTVRLMPTKHKTKTLPGKTFDGRESDAAIGSIVVEVFESERFFPFLGWQEPKGQLDEFFTARFSRTVSGKRYEFLFISVIRLVSHHYIDGVFCSTRTGPHRTSRTSYSPRGGGGTARGTRTYRATACASTGRGGRTR